ncbi:MAG: hypothetical protein H0V18_05945 [Pyrinomonadaceae bacterium]|nr:hypothetical protein [Pyrinomonadaceae bacterium]
MSQVSPILRRGTTGYFHWCPACDVMHQLPDGWLFNADVNKPTFSPSFKHGGKRVEIVDGKWTGEWVRDANGAPVDGTCHYVITAGMIHFCNDSWHGRFDVVPMPPIPSHISDFI